MVSAPLTIEAVCLHGSLGPLAALCQVPETWNPKPLQQQRLCGKHPAQVIAPQGRLAERGGGGRKLGRS